MLHSKPHLFIAIKLWLICWLITGNAYSQSPVYKNYTVNDGLPSQVVYCALQDKEGYMWFGTDAGVSRFDGRHFENFTSNDGLSDNEVLKVFEDSSHRIWFLMANGTISYYLHGKICNSLNEVSLKNVKARRELMSFFEDHDHNLWFGSSGGQLVFLPRKGQSRVLDMDSQKLQGSNSLVYAFQDNMEMMLIVGSSLYSMKDFHLSLIDTTCYINRTTVYVVKEALDSVSTAISFKNGIGEMKDGKISMLLRKEEIPHYELVQRMVIDKEGGIWLFSSNLTTSFFKVSNTGYHQKSYLEGIYVASVFIDNEGSKWFCTVGNGIFKLTKYDDQITLFQGSSFNKEVWSVNIDSKDGIWFGNGTRTLYRIINDSIDLAVDLGNEQYKNGRITRIDFDYLGNVWCTLGNGIVCLRIDAEKKAKIEEVRTIHNLRFFNAKYFRFDRYNQPFFSSNKGIQKIYQVNGKYVFDIYVPEFLDPFAKVFCLYFDNRNCLWYEKFNTLISYDGRKVKKYSELTNQFKSQISSIEGFQDSILVIATYGNGIQFFRDGKIINHLTMAEGLAGDLCRKVFVDSNVIYVATNQGFSYFNYENNRITDLKTITVSDGIVSNDIKDICARGDKIYLATSAGLCIVNKNISQSSAAAPPVYITSVSTRDSTLESVDHLRFPYNTDLNLNYIAITFEQPDKITYQYNITGNEKDWITTANTSIAFSSLSPGDYTFRLRAKKYNSDWSKTTAIHFSIIPPFWQQWWFRLLFFSALAGSTYYLLQYAAERRYRQQLRLLKEKQALADERSRISSDMHDDLGADLSNLLLMTRMSGQTSSLVESEKNQLHKLEDFASSLAGKVDEIIWALNPRNDTLRGMLQFIHDYTLNIAQLSSLKATVHIPDQVSSRAVSAIFRRNIFLVVKEALNNIVRHSKATHLSVDIRMTDNYLELIIEDDGRGFDIHHLQSDGDGLLNMKKRIEELKGRFSLLPSINKGVRVSMNVPIS